MFSSKLDFTELFILLILLRHGGEWPDWGNPFGQVLIGVTVEKIASHVRDEEVRSKLQNIAADVLRSQAKAYER